MVSQERETFVEFRKADVVRMPEKSRVAIVAKPTGVRNKN